jgi:hypothetical protein
MRVWLLLAAHDSTTEGINMNWLRRVLQLRCPVTVRDMVNYPVRCLLAYHVDGEHYGRDHRGYVVMWGERAPGGILTIKHER